MRDVFNEIISFLNTNHILAVFFICVIASLVFIIASKKKVPAAGLIIYSVITALLLLFLPTAFLFRKFQTVFFTYTTLWVMVPMIPVTAFVLTLALPKLKTLKKPVAVTTFVLCLFLMLSCGSLGVLSSKGRELPKYKDEEISFAESLPILHRMDELSVSADEGSEDPFIFLAPPALTEYARQYSGNIKLLYGRDLWDGSLAAYNYNSYSKEQTVLYEWMLYSDAYGAINFVNMDVHDEFHGFSAYGDLARSLGADAVIFFVNENTDRTDFEFIENELSAHSEFIEVNSPVCEGFMILYL